MSDPNLTTDPSFTSPSSDEPKAHFAKAVEEARVGAQLIGKQAQDRADAYKEKLGQASDEWVATAKAKGDEAKDRAYLMANEGKARASEALTGLSKMVDENAAVVDERLGVRYGDYVRGAARSMQDGAERLDAKDFPELAEDARALVRANPAMAVGLAAFGGFMLARMFKGSTD